MTGAIRLMLNRATWFPPGDPALVGGFKLSTTIFAFANECQWKFVNATIRLKAGARQAMRCCKCCEMAGYKTLYRLTNSLPYVLNRVGVQMGELFSRRIKGFGVTLPMYRVMAALWEKKDQRLGDLAAMTSIEISTLSRLVGEMKRRGLVSRSRLKDNGRTVAINLAPKGRALVEELIPIAVHFEEVAVRNFPSGK